VCDDATGLGKPEEDALALRHALGSGGWVVGMVELEWRLRGGKYGKGFGYGEEWLWVERSSWSRMKLKVRGDGHTDTQTHTDAQTHRHTDTKTHRHTEIRIYGRHTCMRYVRMREMRKTS
jgi:hypothetical protein